LRLLPRLVHRPLAPEYEMMGSKRDSLLPSEANNVATVAGFRTSPALACSPSLLPTTLSPLSSSLPEHYLHAHVYNNNAHPTPPHSTAASFTAMQDSKIVLTTQGATLFARTRSFDQRPRSLVELTSQSRQVSLASQALSNVLTKTVVSAHITRPVNSAPHPPDFYTASACPCSLPVIVIVTAGRTIANLKLCTTEYPSSHSANGFICRQV
jgi:hypothetical protein